MPKHEEYRVFVLMAYWNEMCILVALPMRHAMGYGNVIAPIACKCIILKRPKFIHFIDSQST